MYLILAKIGAVVLLVLGIFATGHHYGAKSVRLQWNAERLERAESINTAVAARLKENAALGAKQDATNATITKAKHEELAPVRERIVTQRVYVGPAICGDRSAIAAQAEGAAGSDSADPGGRVLPPEVERDIRALILETEEAAATGRACQRFLAENGLTP